MSKFKVGDRVRLILDYPLMCDDGGKNQRTSPWKKGKETTVKEIDNEGRFVRYYDYNIWHYEIHWELIEAKHELTNDEFLEHIKKNGITKARITKGFRSVPSGTVLYFGEYDDGISTWDDDVNSTNMTLDYDFEYRKLWKDYKGSFVILDDDDVLGIAIEDVKKGETVKVSISGHSSLTEELIDVDMEDIKKFDKAVLKDAEAQALEEIRLEQVAVAKAKFKTMHLMVVEAEKRKTDAEDELKAFKSELKALAVK